LLERPQLALENSVPRIDRLKKLAANRDIFRRAQEQKSARVQGEMEKGQQTFLQIHFEIDQQVTARNQIQLGERRILDEAVRRKNAELPHFLAHLVAVLFLAKKAAQTFRRNLFHRLRRITRLAGDFERSSIEI